MITEPMHGIGRSQQIPRQDGLRRSSVRLRTTAGFSKKLEAQTEQVQKLTVEEARVLDWVTGGLRPRYLLAGGGERLTRRCTPAKVLIVVPLQPQRLLTSSYRRAAPHS